MSALLRCKKNDEIEIRKVEQLLQSILQLETEVDDDCSYNLRALDFVDQWPSLEFKLQENRDLQKKCQIIKKSEMIESSNDEDFVISEGMKIPESINDYLP